MITGRWPVPEALPFAQGSEPWGTMDIVPGDKTTRMSRIGCAVVCIAEAGRRLGSPRLLLPHELLKAARDIDGFAGTKSQPNRKVLVKWAEVAGILGLSVEVGQRWIRNSVDLSLLRHGLHLALREGGAIIHVDHSPAESGHWMGDHYLYAHRVDGEFVLCCDPAIGSWVWVPSDTLRCASPYGADRPYQVRGVMPIRRGVM